MQEGRRIDFKVAPKRRLVVSALDAHGERCVRGERSIFPFQGYYSDCIIIFRSERSCRLDRRRDRDGMLNISFGNARITVASEVTKRPLNLDSKFFSVITFYRCLGLG